MNISPRKKLNAVIEACMAIVAGSALLLFAVMAWGMDFDVRGGNGIAAVTPRGAGKVAIRLPALPQPPEESTNEQAVARRAGAEVAGLTATSSNPQADPMETAASIAGPGEPTQAPLNRSSDQPDSPDEVVVAVSGPAVSAPGTSPPDGDTGTDTGTNTGAAPSPEPEPGQDHNPSTDDDRSAPPKDHPAPEGPDPAPPEEKAEPQEQPPPQDDAGEGTSDQAPGRPDEPPASERPDHHPPSGPEDEGGDGGEGSGKKGGNDNP
jgi:hypothetical protein